MFVLHLPIAAEIERWGETQTKVQYVLTGGTGFLASWLVMRLLEHGYSVHTTIRPDPEHKRDVSFLTSLPGASKKLQIFEADLSDPDSFEAAIKGCIGVFLAATPVDIENKEPEKVIVKRALDGALGILKTCLNSKTVKRVVYTSSASAVVFNDKVAHAMDESFWNDTNYIKSLMSPFASYLISKILTEKKALDFAQEHGLDLVTVVPSFIVGPFNCPKFPGSVHTSFAMILGEKEQYSALLNMSMVHTDDVARAHIFLLENPDAKGRYICSSNTMTIEELSKFLSHKYPEYPIPTIDALQDIKGHKSARLSSQKLLKLGFKFKHGPDEMFDDAIQTCREKGHL
ncbi:vestitone reductase [Ricinus communis]|uniref:Cinnamoyl-CoA reductase, putative n=1 Tax=Ricinus communis TaxID=3988 RepID=B9RDC8_RICCO|nr:vestitone reductase [Ricinus communis]EEF50386.1 cinnamoyl-CoA reductase, putative [Ricinus communis]